MITTNCSYGNHLKKKMKSIWLLMIAFVFSTSIYAQEKTITGQVTSSTDGMGLPSVNVVIKGTSKGVSTDFDGNYSIEASTGDVLEFSFIGFKTKDVVVANQSTINVTLEEDVSNLDEVVVIGYGTQKKSDLTGSVSVVKPEAAQKTISHDVAKMLQGQAAGVTVQSSGEPGSFVNIKIRGVTSFTNNNPLFVIDGVITDSPYDFAPSDIESIQILKDASSAAIYGVRGANGVVIITTKKGKDGKMSIKYKTSAGVQTIPENRWYSLANRQQYQQITSQAELNDGLAVVPGNDPNSEFYIDNVDTDWQAEAFKTGSVQNHNLSLSGGAATFNYNANLDYFKQTSYFNSPQDYERIAASFSLGGEKGRFKYGANVKYSASSKEGFNEYLPGSTPMLNLIQAIPTMPVYDSNRLGGYGGADNATQRAITLNVIGYNNLLDNETLRNRFLGNFWGEYEIIDGLTYKLNVSADRLDQGIRTFTPPSDLGWYYITTNDEASLNVNSYNQTNTILNNLLTYKTTIAEKHGVEVMGGLVHERFDSYDHTSRGVGYTPGEISQLNYADSQSAREYERTITRSSLLARLNYEFDDRYLAQFNFRQDKSSKFAPRNDTANYFSFSLGWKLHNEDFITLPDWINTVKLRTGYGELGNNPIAAYGYEATVNSFSNYLFGDNLAPGVIVTDIKDPNIKWETTTTTNVGADVSMFNGQLEFTGEYFVKKSIDLLAPVPLPYSTGAFPASIVTNAADIQNKGFEVAVTYRKVSDNFSYNISGNLTKVKNEVLKIGDDDLPISGSASRTEVGRSIGEIYAYETDGIFQNQAEIDAHATQPLAQPGDVRFKDLNGDGIITDDDRSFQGTTIPKISFGLNLGASYKDFDFSCLFQGAAGHKIYNDMYRSVMIGNYTNHHTDMLNYWTPNNPNTNIPRPTIADPNANARVSDRFIEKGDYVKLQNIELGYSIPFESKTINRARVYVSGQNVFAITSANVYDADFLSDGLFSRGFYNGSFPNPQTFALGLEIEF